MNYAACQWLMFMVVVYGFKPRLLKVEDNRRAESLEAAVRWSSEVDGDGGDSVNERENASNSEKCACMAADKAVSGRGKSAGCNDESGFCWGRASFEGNGAVVGMEGNGLVENLGNIGPRWREGGEASGLAGPISRKMAQLACIPVHEISNNSNLIDSRPTQSPIREPGDTCHEHISLIP